VSEQSDINARQSGVNATQSKLNDTTSATVDKLVRAARWRKWTQVLLVVLVIALGYLVFRNHVLVQDFQHGAYQSCLSGNNARLANRTIWDHVLGAFLQGPHVTQATKDFVNNTENYIGLHEQSQNCAQLYPSAPWWHFWS
jgi:hypothetical protein